jgi:hypothetical protein
MSHNQDGKRSAPSRFFFQKVRVSHQNTRVVDPGCQRCQHCRMRQQLSCAANGGATTLSQCAPGAERENEGGVPCP